MYLNGTLSHKWHVSWTSAQEKQWHTQRQKERFSQLLSAIVDLTVSQSNYVCWQKRCLLQVLTNFSGRKLNMSNSKRQERKDEKQDKKGDESERENVRMQANRLFQAPVQERTQQPTLSQRIRVMERAGGGGAKEAEKEGAEGRGRDASLR